MSDTFPKKPRGILIAGNWKMNHGPSDTGKFFATLHELSSQVFSAPQHPIQKGSLKACLIPPFVSLVQARTEVSRLPFPLNIAAQNAHWEKKGAFTGEISGPMLEELGIHWVLVGHSERRQYFGETDRTVHLRAQSLLAQGFSVILCVGETKEERQSGKTSEVLTRQIQEGLGHPPNDLSKFLNGRLIIAYEPVWAIGTGLTATPEQAEEAHQLIRKLIWNQMGIEASGRTPVLYGGSVTPENIDSLLACPNIDGALVGGASLKPDHFFSLLQAGARVLN